MTAPAPSTRRPSPPWERLHARLLACADERVAAGDAAGGRALRSTVEAWWEEQQRWNAEIAGLLGVHHEINNALVGVSGNAQLLLMGPAGQQPGVRERLEVVMRESQRIREAALQLRELRALLAGTGDPPAPQAARPLPEDAR